MSDLVGTEADTILVCRFCREPMPPAKAQARGKRKVFCSGRCRALHRLRQQQAAIVQTVEALDELIDDVDRIRAVLVGRRAIVQGLVATPRKKMHGTG